MKGITFSQYNNYFNISRIEQKAEPQQNDCCTKAKLYKIALVFFAALLIAGGIGLIALAAKGIILAKPAWFALPCFIGAGAVLWWAYRMKDYEDPNALRDYRINAANTTLETSVEEHGWDNLFRYNILPADLFLEKYNNAMVLKPLKEAMEFHKIATREYQAQARNHNIAPIHFPDPSASFAQKWEEETQGRHVCAILDKFPNIDELHHNGTIEDHQYGALKEANVIYNYVKDAYQTQKDWVEAEYQATIAAWQAQFTLTKESIESERQTLEELENQTRRMQREHVHDSIRDRDDNIVKIRLFADGVDHIFGIDTQRKIRDLEERYRRAETLFNQLSAPARELRDYKLRTLNDGLENLKLQIHNTYRNRLAA